MRIGEMLVHALTDARLQAVKPVIEHAGQMSVLAVDILAHLRKPTIQLRLQPHQGGEFFIELALPLLRQGLGQFVLEHRARTPQNQRKSQNKNHNGQKPRRHRNSCKTEDGLIHDPSPALCQKWPQTSRSAPKVENKKRTI